LKYDSHGLHTLLEQVAATSSRTEKQALLSKALDDPFAKKVFEWTYDPFITFGLTPPLDPKLGDNTFDLGSTYIWELLKELSNRDLTGNAAQERVLTAMSGLDITSAELLWRILSKDLRAGFTGNTLNKLRPGYIRSFDVMLSHKFEERHVKHFPVAVEPKLDGLRAICLINGKQAGFYSRVGNHFPALDPLALKVRDMVHAFLNSEETSDEHVEHFFGDFDDGDDVKIALEGEVLSGLFAETSGAVRRKSETADDAEYHIFDIAPYDFMTSHSPAQPFVLEYAERRKFLTRLLKFNFLATKWIPYEFEDPTVKVVEAKVARPIIRLVPMKIALNEADIHSIFETFRATPLANYLALDDHRQIPYFAKLTIDKTTGGFQPLEGAIVKNLRGLYEKKRSRNWLKMKAEETEDLRVIGAYEGEGKYAGKLGGLIVDRKGVEVRVGGGFTDAQREELWDNPSIGSLIEVEYQEVMESGNLRHSRFVRFRPDKDENLRAA